jgi:DNA helicase HerA-like ATPase
MLYHEDRVHPFASGDERTCRNQTSEAAKPLGRVIAVSGSQVTAQFSFGTSSSGDREADVTVGSLVGIRSGATLAVGTLCDISAERSASGERDGETIGRIDLLGEIAAEKSGERAFQAGIAAYPKIGSAVIGIGADELQIIFGLSSSSNIEIGHLQQNPSITATVNVEEMVRKHFAIVGSTGSGKSSGLALILRKIMQARSDLRILLIDAHNEYADCFDDRAQVFGPGNMKLPFWLFNFDELTQIIFGSLSHAEHEMSLLAELIPLAKSEFARAKNAPRSSYRPSQSDDGRYTVDTPVPYRLEDLVAAAESRMGKLENGDLAVAYQRLLMRINGARKNPRYSFIFNDGGDANDAMVDILSQLLRLSDEQRPVAVVQLAGFPAETMEVIVSVLFRLAFEFGVWSDGCSPLLIVCEEAHNYANADRTVGFRSARDGLSRIAKEGRKHGVFLGLVTQRPHQLDATLISQCSTVFAMRLGHEDDQKIVRAAVSDSASRLLSFLPSLGTREALVIGAGVPTVTRLLFEELPENCIPRSQAVWGGELDCATRIDEQSIAAIVARWRGTATTGKPAAAPPIADARAHSRDVMSWSAPSYRG